MQNRLDGVFALNWETFHAFTGKQLEKSLTFVKTHWIFPLCTGQNESDRSHAFISPLVMCSVKRAPLVNSPPENLKVYDWVKMPVRTCCWAHGVCNYVKVWAYLRIWRSSEIACNDTPIIMSCSYVLHAGFLVISYLFDIVTVNDSFVCQVQHHIYYSA